MEKTTILSLKPGDCARVSAIHGTGSVRQRLLDMGLLPHQSLTLERFAPGGAPVWIVVCNTHIALRREEAALIEIEALPS